MAKNRASESPSESEQRKACNRLRLADKRANESPSESEQRRAKNRCLIANTRAQPKSIEKLIQEFLVKVKLGPDYVCTCCHRMLYRHSVIGFNPPSTLKPAQSCWGNCVSIFMLLVKVNSGCVRHTVCITVGMLQNLDSGLWTGPWTGLWTT